MSRSIIYQIFKLFVFIACSVIVLYMTEKEIQRYFKNKNTSSIAIKYFQKTGDQASTYPTFTICFFGSSVIYDFKKFKQRYGGWEEPLRERIRQYGNILSGFQKVNAAMLETFPIFSSLTIDLKDLIRSYRSENENHDSINEWDTVNDTELYPINGTTFSYWPFHVSYQTPRMICFTWIDHFPDNIYKQIDVINLKVPTLKRLEWKNQRCTCGKLYLFVHAEGQLIRNLDKPALTLDTSLDPIDGVQHEIELKRVDVLKRRKDENIPCKSYAESEDIEYMKTVIEEIKCIPPYWKSLDLNAAETRLCDSTLMLKNLTEEYNGWYPEPKRWTSLKWRPCYKMVVSTVHHENNNLTSFRLRLRYNGLNSQYVEIVNTRDFSFENLFSSIGGIVGVFLGVSIIGTLQMLSQGLRWVKTRIISRYNADICSQAPTDAASDMSNKIPSNTPNPQSKSDDHSGENELHHPSLSGDNIRNNYFLPAPYREKKQEDTNVDTKFSNDEMA